MLAFNFIGYNRPMSIHEKLVKWYLENQRDLPFRQNTEPYRVWISEIMAQQTQIDTLIPYYLKWMDQFPSIQEVATAQPERLLKAWEGLGYYSRVRNIQKAAQQIQEAHQGTFPHQLIDIQKLSGIGPYTASAIASICFDEKTAAIDGNVKRVMSRLFCLNNLDKTFTVQIQQTIEQWMNDVRPNHLTQGLMELGALVCTKQAKCQVCPLKENCCAYQNQAQLNYPIVEKKMEKKIEKKQIILISYQEEIALTLDHHDQLMKGYYRLPEYSQVNVEESKLSFDQKLNHVFSHKIWEVEFFTLNVIEKDPKFIWVKTSQLEQYPIITLHRKYLDSKTFKV